MSSETEPTWEMAPSSLPWAQPMLPVTWPMAWLASAEMPEREPAPLPRAPESWAARLVALARVSERVPSASVRLPETRVALPERSCRVERAWATVTRASARVPWAPSRPSARPARVPETSRRSVTTVSRVSSALVAAPPMASWSFSVTVLPATSRNWSVISLSRVVEPVSVTLGATALAFSLT